MKRIKREFSDARTQQQNGVAERKNKTLIEAARTMLVDSKLPTTFWAEAVNAQQQNRDHRKHQLNELNELRDQAYENSLIYKEKTKKLHNSKIKNQIFNVGDQVLLFNSRLKIFSEKLKTRWSGPFLNNVL
ncbi:reverse transcriptase domain-containing protein [Tanacetum coccineum]